MDGTHLSLELQISSKMFTFLDSFESTDSLAAVAFIEKKFEE